MIIPFAPGGSTDFVARVIQPHFAEELGQQVVADFRPGAAGNIGIEIAARATPDGYTFTFANIGAIAINPSLYPNFPIRPLRDLSPITLVVDVPSILVANSGFPPNNVKEFIDYAKSNRGKINFASPGVGSANRLDMEFFMRLTGIDGMTHVTYKGGAGPAVIGLVGGETQIMFVTFTSAVPFVQQGRLKAFGVTAPKRVAALPDVPTMPELGYPTMNTASWQGFFLPKGVPPQIVERLFRATLKIMNNPEVKKRLTEGGVNVVLSRSPSEFTQFVKTETDRLSGLIKAANIVVE